jgi:hypothetical protein|tara:strand:- start:3248 stop:3676 length:429 start_codon:yes stop_codon:yes gene_type:complete
MDLKTLQEEVDKDIKIKSDSLDIESLRIPEIHNKYLKYYNRFQLVLRKTETDYKELYKEKWEYYTGKSSDEVYKENPFNFKILKADIPTYLESDKDLIELQHKISYNKTIVTYLEQVLRSINSRTFTIKNAIEWKKFEAGVI